MSRRGLGRGLATLIPEAPPGSEDTKIRMVPIEQIRPNPSQPREVFDEAALQSLTASIREHGVLLPLLVRREDGRYVLIAGERRLRASGRAGLAQVPVMVRDVTPQEQLELALVENLQRSDLDPIEAAQGYRRLITDFGLTQAQVADRVGKERPTIANALRLLKLPRLALEALRGGHISSGHARALLPLEEPELQAQALDRVTHEGLSVRATERLVNSLLRPKPSPGSQLPTFERTTSRLKKALSAAVQIRPRRKGGGKIVIEYGDDETLERLVQQLSR